MLNIAISYPFQNGNKAQEDNPLWDCFILLLEALRISTSRVMSPDFASYLKVLIDQYHSNFKVCSLVVSFTAQFY